MVKKIRVTAAAVCISMVLALLFSAAYITAESDHDCTVYECPICRLIDVCVQVLKIFGIASVLTIPLSSVFIVVWKNAASYNSSITADTPVRLKVKLTD